jgi:hypothetical protein
MEPKEPTMSVLTPEQKRAVIEAGDRPVMLEDPETREAYVLPRQDAYDRLHAPRPSATPPPPPDLEEIPEGIRLSQDAFFRDLPEMLKDKKLLGKWVAYHRDERVKVGKKQIDVIRELNRRNVPDDEFAIYVVRPQSREPEEIEHVTGYFL